MNTPLPHLMVPEFEAYLETHKMARALTELVKGCSAFHWRSFLSTKDYTGCPLSLTPDSRPRHAEPPEVGQWAGHVAQSRPLLRPTADEASFARSPFALSPFLFVL